jgi:hypothetical protein
MSELVPVRRVPRLVEGEVLPRESDRERALRDPYYFANAAYRDMLNGVRSGTVVDRVPQTRDWHPSPFMRRLGYLSNPDTCRHPRKGYTPRDGWWCKECGENL